MRAALVPMFLAVACNTNPLPTPDLPTKTQPSAPTATGTVQPKSTPPSVKTMTTPAASSPAPPPAVSPESPVSDAERAADAAGERAFAARLYGAVAKLKPGNVFLSPSSARFALGMLNGGARGETARELGAVLGATARSHDVAASIANEWAALAVPPGPNPWEQNDVVVLRTANRLFGQRGRAFEPAFLALTKGRYGAPIEAVDFQKDAEGARKLVNAWVEERTERKIQNIVATPPPRDTKLILANAIYFNGKWATPFSEGMTKNEPFYGPAGTTSVPTMRKTASRRYGETPAAHVVELRYGGEIRPDMSMVLVVPKKKDGLAEVEKDLSTTGLEGFTKTLTSSVDVDLAMPKFRIESELSLGDTIAALGAPSLFVFGKADLSGIDGTKELFVGLVLQKTFVSVDEKGTEAAAATIVMMRAGAAMREKPKPVEVRADRPFLFLIRDAKRDRVVFMGRVVEPSR